MTIEKELGIDSNLTITEKCDRCETLNAQSGLMLKLVNMDYHVFCEKSSTELQCG